MVSAFVSLCGNLAPLAGIVVFCAPFPTIQQIIKEKSVGSLPLLPYSSMIANSFLWLVYGYLKGVTKIWGTNLIGLILGMYYFYNFINYAPHKSPSLPGSVQQHINSCLAVIMGTMIFVYYSSSPVQTVTTTTTTMDDSAANMIGNVAVLFCVAMFASPLAALKTVLMTKSAESIPLPFTIATVINCFLWSMLGLFDMHDFNVYFPNLLGLAFGLAQVALKVIFGNNKIKKAESDKMDLIM